MLGAAMLAGPVFAQQQQQDSKSSQGSRMSEQQMQQHRDQRIADRIDERLARSSSLSGTDIITTVKDRTVALKGAVGSEQEKERALRLARRVKGVKEVKDELTIDQAAVDQRRKVNVGDEVLARQVATKLATETFPLADAEEDWFFGWEVEGYTWEFDVDVDDGVVTLEGEVESYGDIIDAIKAARAVPGVRSVTASDLEVDANYYYRGYGPYYGYHYPYYDPYY